MSNEQKAPQAAAPQTPLDLLTRLYREIGISAVAAALEAGFHKAQKPAPKRTDVPAFLRNDEAA